MYKYTEGVETSKTCVSLSKTSKITIAVICLLVLAIVIVVPAVALKHLPNDENSQAEGRLFNSSQSGKTIPRGTPLFIAAFNIKSFGESKLKDKFVLDHIAQILQRYDIVLVQEVRDISGKSLGRVWEKLNMTGTRYGLVVSGRLGRTNYKEQYAFFYRTQVTQHTGLLQFDDSHADVFEREPFTAEFMYYSPEHGAKRRVALMALHTKPKDTVAELSKLPSAMRSALNHFHNSDSVIAMGDLNADCAYLSNKKKDSLELFKANSGFRSLIGHSLDTTVASTTDCAYDRAIVYGKQVKVSDASVFNFQKKFGLTESQAKSISDHFPIEFLLF